MSTLFKVLGPKGEAVHGGSGSWPLPKGKRPGAWVEVKNPKVCSKGLHLVSRPMPWWRSGARLFVAEGDLAAPLSADGTEKAAFSRARLLYEITPDWPLLPMFPEVRVFLAASLYAKGDKEGADKLLARANLAGANLAGANLADAYLAGAYLAGANLADAYLAGAYLTGAYLTGAYLAGANLTRANLADAYLTGAYLADANLARANLTDANLTGANLTRAALAGANRPEGGIAGWKPDASGLLVKA